MTDREKVIKAIENCIGQPKCKDCHWEDCEVEHEVVNSVPYGLMRDALAFLKEQEWHMLTEDNDGIIHGLPGDDGQYIMTDGKYIWVDEYVDGVTDGIILDSGRDIREITAWMYMPKLPEEGR